MAEELKCVMMSTPKSATSGSIGRHRIQRQQDIPCWSPESILAHGKKRNCTPRSDTETQNACDDKAELDDDNSIIVNDDNYRWDLQFTPPPPLPPSSRSLIHTPQTTSPSPLPPRRQYLTSSPPPPSSPPPSPPPPLAPPSSSLYTSHPHLHLDRSEKYFRAPALDRVRTLPPLELRNSAPRIGCYGETMEKSFEGNQSFPKACRQRRRPEPTPADATVTRGSARVMPHNLETFQGDGLNDISFSGREPRKKYFPRLKEVSAMTGSITGGHKSLSESWSFSGFLGGPQQMSSATAALPSTVRNPNKAICTIAAPSTEILTANDMACELFGYEENELVGLFLRDLLRLKSKEQETITEKHLEPSGQIISLAGKVVEVLDSNGLVLPISLWIKHLDNEGYSSTLSPPSSSVSHGDATKEGPVPRPDQSDRHESRLLCVMEPVQRTVGHLQFDGDGEIVWCDDQMAQLCGYSAPHQLSGVHMCQLIPAFHCPDPSQDLTKEVKKQRATGRTRDGVSFPLSIVVRPDQDMEDGRWVPPSQDGDRDKAGSLYHATVWVFANISGLISLRPDGTIHSLNENFARLLFGYNRSELIGQNISKLIPDFFDLLELDRNPLPMPPFDDDDDDDDVCEDDNVDESQNFSAAGGVLDPGAEQGLTPVVRKDCTPKDYTPASLRLADLMPITSTPCCPDVQVSETSNPSGVNRRESQAAESDFLEIESALADSNSSHLQVHNLSPLSPFADSSQNLPLRRSRQSKRFHLDDFSYMERLICGDVRDAVGSKSVADLSLPPAVCEFDDVQISRSGTWPCDHKEKEQRTTDDLWNEYRDMKQRSIDPSDESENRDVQWTDSGNSKNEDVNEHLAGASNEDWDTREREINPVGKHQDVKKQWTESLNENPNIPREQCAGLINNDGLEREHCTTQLKDNQDIIRKPVSLTVENSDLVCQDSPSSSESCRVVGKDSASSSKSYRVIGQDSASSSESCHVIGEDSPSFMESHGEIGPWGDVNQSSRSEDIGRAEDKSRAQADLRDALQPRTGDVYERNTAGGWPVRFVKTSQGSQNCFDEDLEFQHLDDSGPEGLDCDMVVLSCDDEGDYSTYSKDEYGANSLSPLKPLRANVFDSSFTSNYSDDLSCVSDTTSELLMAKVSFCDLLSSDDEGHAESSGQGATADVSGNVDESSHRDFLREMDDGRKSRLSYADVHSLRIGAISGGLGSSSSSSSSSVTREEDGPIYDPPTPSYGLYQPYGPCYYASTTSQTESEAVVLNESSYFSADGAGSSYRCTDSSQSHTSSSGRGKSSDNSTKEMSAESSLGNAPDTVATDSQASAVRVEPDISRDLLPITGGHGQGQIPEGSFSGQGRHKDGGTLGVVFQIRRVTLADGSDMLLLWLSRDPEDMCESSRSHGNLTLASSFNSTMDQSQHSLGELLQEQANSESKLQDIEEKAEHQQEEEEEGEEDSQAATKTLSGNDLDEPEDIHETILASAGQYGECYQTLASVGRGAFGFVKMGHRRSDKQEVVVKFIRRGKVLRESWIKDGNLGVVPMEVFLLSRLSHPNIVKVIDVFQNADFIQMVMERHGSGMDLFEFIDRNPRMDEPLTAHIFRQMVSGVSYLHSENIVHRDIKDENIIIDEKFNIKLIDFGAAAYMLPGKLFGTFCGTIEYCSPEVLKGNKYSGPELEMWSLGITLYTLIFGENPFFDVEETLQGVLKPPTTVSTALMFLITWLLHPDPQCRATIEDVEHHVWVTQSVDPSKYLWERVLPNTEFNGNNACDNRGETPDHDLDLNSLDHKDLEPSRPKSSDSSEEGREEKEVIVRDDVVTKWCAHYDSTPTKDENSDDVIATQVTADFNRLLHLHKHLDDDDY